MNDAGSATLEIVLVMVHGGHEGERVIRVTQTWPSSGVTWIEMDRAFRDALRAAGYHPPEVDA